MLCEEAKDFRSTKAMEGYVGMEPAICPLQCDCCRRVKIEDDEMLDFGREFTKTGGDFFVCHVLVIPM